MEEMGPRGMDINRTPENAERNEKKKHKGFAACPTDILNPLI